MYRMPKPTEQAKASTTISTNSTIDTNGRRTSSDGNLGTLVSTHNGHLKVHPTWYDVLGSPSNFTNSPPSPVNEGQQFVNPTRAELDPYLPPYSTKFLLDLINVFEGRYGPHVMDIGPELRAGEYQDTTKPDGLTYRLPFAEQLIRMAKKAFPRSRFNLFDDDNIRVTFIHNPDEPEGRLVHPTITPIPQQQRDIAHSPAAPLDEDSDNGDDIYESETRPISPDMHDRESIHTTTARLDAGVNDMDSIASSRHPSVEWGHHSNQPPPRGRSPPEEDPFTLVSTSNGEDAD